MPRSDVFTILRQVGFLLLCVLGLYLLFFAASVIISPLSGKSAPIDTYLSQRSVFQTPAKMIFYGRQSLLDDRPQLILLGSSNTQVGFRRDNVAEKVQGYQVHNLGIGDNNIYQLGQIADLAIESMPPETHAKSVFVIGIWYGMFVDNEARWGSTSNPVTDIDRERYRYGLWSRESDGIEQRQTAPDAELAAVFLHPLFVFETVLRKTTKSMRSLVFVRPPVFDNELRNTRVVSDDEKQRAFDFREQYMGRNELIDEQYQELNKVLRKLDAADVKTIVAFLPIPEWHAKGSQYDAHHNQKLTIYAEQFTSFENVSSLDLRDLNSDDSFYDDAHVRPRNQGAWTDRLFLELDKMKTAGRISQSG